MTLKKTNTSNKWKTTAKKTNKTTQNNTQTND